MKNKKEYEPPTVRAVRLEVKTSVLAFCHQSPTNVPLVGGVSCTVRQCYNA